MLTDLAARKVAAPPLRGRARAGRPGLHRRRQDRRQRRRPWARPRPRRRSSRARVATLGRGGSDLTATLLGRALSAQRDLALEGRPGAAHRRSTGRPRRARHPAAARARGGRAGLLRRQGAAPARAHPGRRPLDPGLRPAVRRRRRRRAPRSRRAARSISTRSRRSPRPAGRRCSPSRATACWACRASRRAPSRRCTTRASASRSSRSRRRSSRSASPCPRGRRGARAIGSPRSSAIRSRAGRSTASSSRSGPRDGGGGRHRHGGPPGHRGARVRRAGRGRASTSSPSRRARRSSTSRSSWRPRTRRPRSGRSTAPSSSSKIGGGAATRAAHTDAVLLGFGQIGRTLAEIMAQGNGGKNGTGGQRQSQAAPGRRHRSPRLRLRAQRPVRRGRWRRSSAAKKAGEVAGRRRRAARRAAADALAVAGRARAQRSDAGRRHRRRDARRSSGRRSARGWTSCSPTSGRSRASRADSEALTALAERAGRRIFTEATVGAGLPIFDTLPQARRVGRSRAQDRRLPVGHARLRADRGGARAVLLRGARGARWSSATPSRIRATICRAPTSGRKALILGRLLDFAGEPGRRRGRVAGAGRAAALPRDAFLARLADVDADWSRRAAAAKAKGATLRYVASVTKDRISVGLQVVDRAEPVLRPQGDRQPGRLHDRRATQEPAGHHRPRRRPGRHGRRRAQRHAPRQRLTACQRPPNHRAAQNDRVERRRALPAGAHRGRIGTLLGFQSKKTGGRGLPFSAAQVLSFRCLVA